MLLSFVGGYLADRYNRWALMFSGFTVAAFAWIIYGITDNLTLFLVVNVDRGARLRLVVSGQAGLPRAGGAAALAGERAGTGADLRAGGGARRAPWLAPVLYGYMSGYVISLAGVVSLVGLGCRGAHPLPGVATGSRRARQTVEEADEEAIEIPLRQL